MNKNTWRNLAVFATFAFLLCMFSHPPVACAGWLDNSDSDSDSAKVTKPKNPKPKRKPPTWWKNKDTKKVTNNVDVKNDVNVKNNVDVKNNVVATGGEANSTSESFVKFHYDEGREAANSAASHYTQLCMKGMGGQGLTFGASSVSMEDFCKLWLAADENDKEARKAAALGNNEVAEYHFNVAREQRVAANRVVKVQTEHPLTRYFMRPVFGWVPFLKDHL